MDFYLRPLKISGSSEREIPFPFDLIHKDCFLKKNFKYKKQLKTFFQ